MHKPIYAEKNAWRARKPGYAKRRARVKSTLESSDNNMNYNIYNNFFFRVGRDARKPSFKLPRQATLLLSCQARKKDWILSRTTSQFHFIALTNFADSLVFYSKKTPSNRCIFNFASILILKCKPSYEVNYINMIP